jgi:exonuclease SbcC
MTAGRYAFAERFQMLDAQTQQTRDPRTLSGGEKFLASLALALGLVEIAAEAGGPLDALFLDEGFGSLDSNALDIALSELAGRATSGKMIGVITHVRGVAAEIETILRVQRLPGGSVVTKLTASEREEMLDDATVSGLLEAAV